VDLLETAKTALRLKGTALDGEVKGLIAAAIADMHRVGLVFEEDQLKDKPLHVQAIMLYCKGNYGYIPNSEKFAVAYERLLITLKVSGES